MSVAVNNTILIADDEAISRSILAEILKDKYRILEAENGNQAVMYIKSQKENISLIILDIHMPKLSGFDVMNYLAESGLRDNVPVIITTADQSSEVLMQATQHRAADVIYKPYNANDIRKKIDLLIGIKNVENNMDSILQEAVAIVEKEYATIRKMHLFQIGRAQENFAMLMSQVQPEKTDHNHRVRVYTEIFGDKLLEGNSSLKVDKQTLKLIRDAIPLHSIGSLVIPEDIYKKDEKVTERAYNQIKRRPIASAEMVNIIFADVVAQKRVKVCYNICRYLHERYDGKGYPDGLKGEEIPIEAQIFSLVHRYDELLYNDEHPLNSEQAMRVLTEEEADSFNPYLLNAFEEIMDQLALVSK